MIMTNLSELLFLRSLSFSALFIVWDELYNKPMHQSDFSAEDALKKLRPDLV